MCEFLFDSAYSRIHARVGALLQPPVLPDEEVARPHVGKLGVRIETLSGYQFEYLGLPAEGPFKPEFYRY